MDSNALATLKASLEARSGGKQREAGVRGLSAVELRLLLAIREVEAEQQLHANDCPRCGVETICGELCADCTADVALEAARGEERPEQRCPARE